jgi:hypothetical protein
MKIRPKYKIWRESGVEYMAKMVFGIFESRVGAEDAIAELEEEGFNPEDVSIVMKDKAEAEAIRDKTGASVAEGAVSGAATGAAIGGLAGLLVGVGAIALPGIGALFIGGPIAAALGLTGAAATTVSGATTGALAGGLIGALMGIGVPEKEAKIYEERIKAGAILVAAPAETGERKEVSAIMREHGAEQVKTIDIDQDSVRSTHSHAHL